MKKILPKILFYYSALASFLIVVSTVFTSQTLTPVIFAIFFLPVTAYFVVEFFQQIRGKGLDVSSGPKRGEFLVVTIIFFILLVLGIRNIYNSRASAETSQAEATSSPLIFKNQPSPTPAVTVTISITDSSPSVNIRKSPTVYSDKVAEAKDGDVFEYISKDSGWYKIKLENGDFGYISAKYIKQ